MKGGIILLLLYDFMAWLGAILLLTLPCTDLQAQATNFRYCYYSFCYLFTCTTELFA